MATSEQEAIVDSRAFRDVMGLFATGVTVVAAVSDGQTQGMTANAITSVSLDPLLILICVQKNAVMAQVLKKAEKFSINILNEKQENLSNYFAGIWPENADPPYFVFEPWQDVARLRGAIGALACEIDKFLDGGDHWIVTAFVVDLYRQANPDTPLLYYQGLYHHICAE